MKKSKKSLFLAALSVMLMVAATSCGDKEKDKDKDMGTENNNKQDVVALAQTASGRSEEYVQELNGEWKFGGKMLSVEKLKEADYTKWENVTIPHTWNAADGEDGGANYARTAYWYHKEFTVNKQDGKRIYIEFLGSNTKTTVYVNGEKAGDMHRGGYTAFRYDITDLVKKGTNVLDVKVDNIADQSIAPISGDFNMYGGIYRRVYLVTVDDVHIDLENHGSSGLFLTTGNMRSETKPADLGKFTVKTDIVNSSEKEKEVEVVINVKGDNAPAAITEKVKVAANSKLTYTKEVTVENPTLWEGIRYTKDADNSKAGYQYEVSVELKTAGKVVDKVSDKMGFRYFWIDVSKDGEAGEGFFLNGKSYPLRGVNRHSYKAKVGSAMTEEMHKADMDIMLELGINTVRLCHYPQTDYFYDLCDENGIVVWTEIPTVNMIGSNADFEEVTKNQLTELVFQQYNRPSVVFWGLENEIGNGTDLFNATANAQVAKAKKLLYNLDNYLKEIDTTGRFSTQAVNRDYAMNQNDSDSVNKDFENNTGWKSDTVAWNIYPGWYPDANFYGTFADVMARKGALDNRSMGISEYGWGANPHQHEAYPELGSNNLTSGGPWHPEEYQNIMNEEALEYINNHNELWGTYYWVMFDFAVDARNEGGQIALNDKGLVTADRKIKKDSYYLYKANWNKKDLFAYISSKRWNDRTDEETYIKVYSNCDEVELFVNDKSLGKMEAKGNGVFIIEDIKLEIGEANIRVVGKCKGDSDEYTDKCMWNVKKAPVNPDDNKPKNLCTKKKVEVSSFEIGNYAKNAVDGDSTTRWVAMDASYPQTITIDMEEVFFVGDLTLEWDTKGGNRTYQYYVEVSEDGKTYTEVIDRRNNTTMGKIVESLKHVKARYIKVTAVGCNVNGWATLFEVKADGYTFVSEKYTIDHNKKKIIVDEMPESGIAESTFAENAGFEGNYTYKVNLSSGWIHEGNTVDVFNLAGEKVATYTIEAK